MTPSNHCRSHSAAKTDAKHYKLANNLVERKGRMCMSANPAANSDAKHDKLAGTLVKR